jgi:hypothetical protein
VTTRRRRLHIVVTCANRKRRPVPATLQLRRTTGVRPIQRAARWMQRLTASDLDTVRAEDLYAGEHWDIARALPRLAATGFARPTLWVASAGWGLIPIDAAIRPYSATFSTRHLDSVSDNAQGAQDWWSAIAAWQGPTPGAARSLTALVADHPRDRVLLVLSQPYFAACGNDLRDAITIANDSMISIIAAGVTPQPTFEAWQLPADARLQHHVGGTRGSLNVRIAADLFTTGLTDHGAMSLHLRHRLTAAPDLPTYERRRLADDEVITFIRARRATDTNLSRTSLLRELRDGGMACEQARFADLFATATRSVS